MAYGLPVEGDDGPFVGERLSGAATCEVTLTVAEARKMFDVTGTDVIVLLGTDDLVVGDVDEATLNGKADDVNLLDILRPVPQTVRPSVTVASVADSGGGMLVTTADGRLLGRATIESTEHADHEGHDHEGHDHDEPRVDKERYEQELTAVMTAVEDHFGSREPPVDELKAFLRDRLVAEGRSPEEADRFVEGLGEGEDD